MSFVETDDKDDDGIRRSQRNNFGVPPNRYTPDTRTEQGERFGGVNFGFGRQVYTPLSAGRGRAMEFGNAPFGTGQLIAGGSAFRVTNNEHKSETVSQTGKSKVQFNDNKSKCAASSHSSAGAKKIQALIDAEKEKSAIEEEEMQLKLEMLRMKKEKVIKLSKLQQQLFEETDMNTDVDDLKLPEMEEEEKLNRYFDSQKEVEQEVTAASHYYPKAEMKKPVVVSYANPTQSQQLARRTIGKELPMFTGELEEWEAFHSSFQIANQMCGYTDTENLYRLQKCLAGKARETVLALLVTPGNVPRIISTLQQRFGRPEDIIKKWLKKISDVPVVTEQNPSSIVDYGVFVNNVVVTIENLNRSEYLMNPNLLSELENKLPPAYKMNWSMYISAINIHSPTLRNFADWLDRMVIAAQRFDTSFMDGKEDKPTKKFEKSQPKKVFTTTTTSSSNGDRKCHFCSKLGHFLRICRSFGNLSVDDRWKWVKEQKRCFSCLGEGHSKGACERKQECGTNGCTRPHHPLLHSEKKAVREDENPEARKAVKEDETPETKTVCAAHSFVASSSEVLLKIVPVTVKGPTCEIQTHALFDDGSQMTIIDEELANELGLTGPKEAMSLQGLCPTGENYLDSRKVTLQIRNPKGGKSYTLNKVRTWNNMNLPSQSIDMKSAVRKWKYLDGRGLQSLKNAVPKILIGEDNIHLIMPRESIEGKENEPVLSKTRLGWVLHGNAKQEDWIAKPKQMHSLTLCQRNLDEELHSLVKESFKTESFGVQVPRVVLKSNDDTRAEKIMEDTTRRIGDKWETGLLWKHDEVYFPESRAMAYNRLKSLERKLDKDSKYAELYYAKMKENHDKGYIKRITHEEEARCPKSWYIPHFGVVNPQKPGKIRLVYDAAANSSGVSLNDNLLTGPDLYNSLVGILMKFRQKRIAFCADIQEMFLQIKIREEDLPAQKFLWRGKDRDREPVIYAMPVMIFGAACSPASAQYVKNRNAEEFRDQFPDAVNAIVNKHYMDDYIDSVDTTEEATKIIRDIIHVHQKGGFTIRSWISNSREVLEGIPEDLRAKEFKNLNVETENLLERVLGLYWNSQADELTFKINFPKVDKEIVSGDRKPTKREMLKLIMSVYDPLGIIAHFTVKMKILLQDVWRSGIDWDEVLPVELHPKWDAWISELRKVTDIQVPRCYSILTDVKRQLHLFCDASLKAFCAVAYLRMEHHGQVSTAFVIARTRVAPLKAMTIPRLELQAAVMASRLAKTIKDEIELEIESVHFWSDSRNVLCWIRSDSRRYKQFVGFRVGEILESTDVSEWRWVPTEENVADEGTRDVSKADMGKESRWFVGPRFLRKGQSEWPVEVSSGIENVREEELEVKSQHVMLCCEPSTDFLFDTTNISNWNRLIRKTAWILRFVKILRANKRKQKCKFGPHLTANECNEAEKVWLIRIQWDSFPEEMEMLAKGNEVLKTSKIYGLSPKLNVDGLIVVDGRIGKALRVADTMKTPVILSPRHRLTKLLIASFHVRAGHQGMETVVNELRQRYWILNIRSAVRQAWRDCLECRIRNAKPVPPMMGALPECRLKSYERPFTHTGVDYFGPMMVKIGRRHEKRYGVLFTCMTTRAIHLELAASLSTDSAIMAIRRMIARRGSPKRIYSDNGTNFRGADKELSSALAGWDQDKLNGEMTTRNIEWFFIPPASPHMGGSWERLIQTVKRSLQAVLKEQAPKEEVLLTLLVEAENIVNSRPLTHVSLDHRDDVALTPNHFLIGTSSAAQPPGIFERSDLCLRKQWRNSQYLADLFWKRWLREYLPELPRRTKWFEKRKPVQVGDVVIVCDNTLPRNYWPKGVVTATFPGRDGQIRVVE